MSHKPILQVSRNCWRISRANNVALFIDRESYFNALYHSLSLAQQQILILAWDIYSQLYLLADDVKNRNHLSPTLEQVFTRLLKQKPQLEVNILSWDITQLLALNENSLPRHTLDWKPQQRLKFHLDNVHPPGASHHQKIVVIDDALAFAGGLDLTQACRYASQQDTSNSKQQSVDGNSLPIWPDHDVQMAVSGSAAAALGSLARERWRRANNEKLARPQDSNNNILWPNELNADIENVDVAIARTEPAYKEYTEVHEIEQLYLDIIAAARDYLYIENQFFSVASITHALAKRLNEKNGPEIILNLPLKIEDRDSQQSLETIRPDLIKSLCEADKYEHLAIYYLHKTDNEEQPGKQHAKVMIMDERIACIGSANLNNQSMYLDTECNLAIEATRDSRRVQDAISNFRNRLLATHLDCTTDEMDQQIKQQSSLIQGIEAIRSEGLSLTPLQTNRNTG